MDYTIDKLKNWNQYTENSTSDHHTNIEVILSNEHLLSKSMKVHREKLNNLKTEFGIQSLTRKNS